MQKEWNHQRILSPAPVKCSPSHNLHKQHKVTGKWLLQNSFPSIPAAAYRPLSLFITGIWNGLISASLGKMEMKTTKWISSGMWKCWCSGWLKTRIARIQSWLCFFFWLGYDKTHTKVRRGLLKIPIIFWQKAHCVITLRFSHGACPHWKF